MKIKILFIAAIFSLTAFNGFSQLRVGSCKTASAGDRFYLTPYVGIGTAKLSSDTITTRSFTWLAGITAHYRFDNFKLGLGARYQEYTKPDLSFIKPYISLEIPLYYGDFEDFGFFVQGGYAIGQQDLPKLDGVFADFGIYYNLILTPSSGLYLASEYSINSLKYKIGLAKESMKINEFKLIVGYRFWF